MLVMFWPFDTFTLMGFVVGFTSNIGVLLSKCRKLSVVVVSLRHQKCPVVPESMMGLLFMAFVASALNAGVEDGLIFFVPFRFLFCLFWLFRWLM